MTPFSEKVIEIIKSIPYGKVATYGQIADLAGNNRAARSVVYILRAYRSELPWHRVINRNGYVVIKNPEWYQTQKSLLSQEGIEVDNQDRVDLDKYRWNGGCFRI